MSRPRVVLGLPNGGTVHLPAARSFLRPYSRDCDIVALAEASGSAAVNNFNTVFAVALDLHDRGKADYFLMIHGDVEPLVPDWIDRLYAEISNHEADWVSAVVPIKEIGSNPRTSTAVGLWSDPWRGAIRYVHVRDRATLPTTFGPEHVCSDPDEVIYLNVGLCIWDLRKPCWSKWEGFEFRSRIVPVRRWALYDRTTSDELGRYDTPAEAEAERSRGQEMHAITERSPQMRSEDWELSRWLRLQEARCLATWAVPVKHLGGGEFHSHVELEAA